MTDIRHAPKEFLAEFITIYRSHPALWKTKSNDYVNRNLQNMGYDALIEFYKKVDPDANRDLVARKIQSLRGSFRKELKKYEKFQRSGAGLDEQYVSSLWYFDLLMFTRDQELPTDSLDSLASSLTPEDYEENFEVVQEIDDAQAETIHQKADVSTPTDEGEGIQQNNVFKKPRTKKIKNQTHRVIAVLAPEQQKLMEACTEALKRIANVDYESAVFGQLVAAKHAKLSTDQRMYAETLISTILNKGILQKLSEQTRIVQQPQGYRYSPSPASSPCEDISNSPTERNPNGSTNNPTPSFNCDQGFYFP